MNTDDIGDIRDRATVARPHAVDDLDGLPTWLKVEAEERRQRHAQMQAGRVPGRPERPRRVVFSGLNRGDRRHA